MRPRWVHCAAPARQAGAATARQRRRRRAMPAAPPTSAAEAPTAPTRPASRAVAAAPRRRPAAAPKAAAAPRGKPSPARERLGERRCCSNPHQQGGTSNPVAAAKAQGRAGKEKRARTGRKERRLHFNGRRPSRRSYCCVPLLQVHAHTSYAAHSSHPPPGEGEATRAPIDAAAAAPWQSAGSSPAPLPGLPTTPRALCHASQARQGLAPKAVATKAAGGGGARGPELPPVMEEEPEACSLAATLLVDPENVGGNVGKLMASAGLRSFARGAAAVAATVVQRLEGQHPHKPHSVLGRLSFSSWPVCPSPSCSLPPTCSSAGGAGRQGVVCCAG